MGTGVSQLPYMKFQRNEAFCRLIVQHALPCLAVIFILLSACAADFASLRPGLEERGHYIQGVPFYDQDDNHCGPAVLAGVVSFWGRTAGNTARHHAGASGTLPLDVEQYLHEAGFETKSLKGNIKTLTARVRQNIPVIALLDIGFGPYRIPHYVTVIGFDEVNKVVILHDGITQNKVIGYDSFVRYWSRAAFWMVVAVPASVKEHS